MIFILQRIGDAIILAFCMWVIYKMGFDAGRKP